MFHLTSGHPQTRVSMTFVSPLLVPWLQHVGKHFPLPLLTPYAICTLSNPHTNAVCILVYIPSQVGGAYILAAV